MEKQYKPKHIPIESQKQKEVRTEVKQEIKEQKSEIKPEVKEQKTEVKNEIKSVESKTKVNKDIQEPKKEAVKISKKEEAVARGLSLPTSKKHCMYISNFIKGKSIDTAILELKEVLKFKRAIPFKGEIPHRHGPGMMSGRYPINAVSLLINVLKGLKGNCLVNGLDLQKTIIYSSSASWASRPPRKGGTRFKRVNIIIKAKEIDNKSGEKK